MRFSTPTSLNRTYIPNFIQIDRKVCEIVWAKIFAFLHSCDLESMSRSIDWYHKVKYNIIYHHTKYESNPFIHARVHANALVYFLFVCCCWVFVLFFFWGGGWRALFLFVLFCFVLFCFYAVCKTTVISLISICLCSLRCSPVVMLCRTTGTQHTWPREWDCPRATALPL